MPAIPIIPRFSTDLLQQAQSIRIAFLDVDGVLTDGGLYIGAHGEDFKRFHTLDGHGLKLLRQAGIEPVVITGRDSAALRHRLAALGIEHAVYGTEHKLPAALRMLEVLGLDWACAAGIGDDWPDLPVLRLCRMAVAPPQAHAEVRNRVHYVTQAAAGQGAVREFCDLLLMATGHYGVFLQQAQFPSALDAP